MKVFMRRNPAASFGCRLVEGETGDVPGDIGVMLVSNGIADKLDPPPEPIEAVPDKPAIAEAKPAQIQQAKPTTEKYTPKLTVPQKSKNKDS